MKVMGIDEAGRGPLIGPLVIAYALVEEKDLPLIGSLGAKDSKLLTPLQREEIYNKLVSHEKVRHGLVILSPADIDDAVLSEEMNLNWLEAVHSADLINQAKPDKAILDCPSPNLVAYTDYLRKLLAVKTQIVAEHKADLKHAIVGAASIIAKVTRDREIETIKKKYKIDFGSGYPSDPRTVYFIKGQYDNPELQAIFRKSWDSYRRLVLSATQKNLNDF